MSILTITYSKSKSTTLTTHDSFGINDQLIDAVDMNILRKHLGRHYIHASIDRNFSKSYRSTSSGDIYPIMYRVDSTKFSQCEYAVLTGQQYAAVLVVDIDHIGSSGGYPKNLNKQVYDRFSYLISNKIGPSFLGINPTNGKCQAIWLINPVYTNSTRLSPSMLLLIETRKVLCRVLQADSSFSHRFSRNPFYTGNSPVAYRWYCQHHCIFSLGEMMQKLRTLETSGNQNYFSYSSGYELISAVKKRRERSKQLKIISQDLEKDLADKFDSINPDLVEGVRIVWISHGRAARDETAFRHALKIAHRIRSADQYLADNKIIDSYEYAYRIAQKYGADGRESEIPPMRDRQTMARRIRGYVLSSRTIPNSPDKTTSNITQAERKTLATFGRRGGKVSSQRWRDTTSQYAQTELKKLRDANERRIIAGELLAAQVKTLILDAKVQGTPIPSSNDIAKSLGVSVRRIQQIRKELGLNARVGRPS